MLTLSSLTIWHRWEQAASGGSGITGSSGESGFAWSKLVAVECSLSSLCQSGFAGCKLLVVDLASLGAVVSLASLVGVKLS